MQPDRVDLLIVGAGPVGLALALALRDSGLRIALADARPREAVAADPRVLALAHGTRLGLERLGVWKALTATPIETIHVSQQGGFGRSMLRATDYELPALGYVASAGALAGVMRAAVDAAGIPVFDSTQVGALTPTADGITATLVGATEGRLDARLAACAEGSLQSDAGDVVEHDYGQHALISVATPAAPHRQLAFERFTADGPLALLPYGRDYAVVHVTPPARADALLALDTAAYRQVLQDRIGDRVHLAAVGERLRYPLLLRYRRNPVGERTVWLGNAAQTLHPVAGQGFNLALRDVCGLADTLLDAARQPGFDPGAPALLAEHARRRRLDRFGTIRFTDGLVRLFSNDLAPLRHARGAGLFLLDVCPPLRHFVARRMMFGARAWP